MFLNQNWITLHYLLIFGTTHFNIPDKSMDPPCYYTNMKQTLWLVKGSLVRIQNGRMTSLGHTLYCISHTERHNEIEYAACFHIMCMAASWKVRILTLYMNRIPRRMLYVCQEWNIANWCEHVLSMYIKEYNHISTPLVCQCPLVLSGLHFPFSAWEQ